MKKDGAKSIRIPFLTLGNLSVMLHFAAWALLFTLPSIIRGDLWKDQGFLMRYYLRTGIYAVIFYMNYCFFVPWLLFKGRRKTYLAAASMLIALLFFGNELFDRYLFPQFSVNKKFEYEMAKLEKEHKIARPPRQMPIIEYLLTTVLVSGFSVGLRFSGKLTANEKQQKELEKERLNSELAFLKNQISPHFLFNTLNNIYSLVQINADDAQRSIIKLSKLMRYLLYETDRGETQLSSEISFLNNYIDLMRLRLTDKVNLKIFFPTDFKDISIPPMLFIPFIENAFKHGCGHNGPSYINISMEIKDRKIIFSCINSSNPKPSGFPKADSGIGLDNVKKRLSLLYPSAHKLSIRQTEGEFAVLLEINGWGRAAV